MPKKIVNANMLDSADEKYQEINQALEEGKAVIIGNKRVKSVAKIRTKTSYLFEIEFDDRTKRSLYLSEFIRISVLVAE
jgi:DUF971 family protein